MWYAIYTKPGKEDSVTYYLQNTGINVLNPKVKLRKFKRNRLVDVIEPFFPCYLFAAFEKARYAHLITYTRGVRYIVGKNNPVSVHDDVINTIKENMDEGNLIAIRPQQFIKGDKVLIKEGPFKDFFGIFERELRGSERVMILLDTIHYRLELDGSFLFKV